MFAARAADVTRSRALLHVAFGAQAVIVQRIMAAELPSQIGLVGAGLIGGSIGQRLARMLPGVPLRVHDMSPGNAAFVAERHPRGSVAVEMTGLAGCDVVFVATPVSTIAGHVAALLTLEGAPVVIDTGSAKTAILDVLSANGVDMARFVPGHPLAGGISAGPGESRAQILASRPFVLAPHDTVEADALDAARTLLDHLGVEVVEMSPSAHDAMLATGSHLPHLIAFALAAMADPADRALIPNSFRGVAGFAEADAQMWADIFHANAGELRKSAEIFTKRLDLLLAMADETAPGALLETLEEARANFDALENDA